MKFTLNTRDLINLAIYFVIYFIISFAFGMLGIIAPIFMFIGWTITLLLGGIIMVLYMYRVPKMWALTLMGLLIGLGMVVTGHPWIFLLAVMIPCFIADTIITRFHSPVQHNTFTVMIGYTLVSVGWFIFGLIPYVNMSQDPTMMKNMIDNMGEEYTDKMIQLFTYQTLGIWAVAVIILSLLGGYLGAKVANKHFRKSGLIK